MPVSDHPILLLSDGVYNFNNKSKVALWTDLYYPVNSEIVKFGSISSVGTICFCTSSFLKAYKTPKGAKTYQKPFDVIYVYHESFGQRSPEYKIDLKNQQFWEFTSDDYDNFVARDSSSKNEGLLIPSLVRNPLILK
jgi:hypothetical protein